MTAKKFTHSFIHSYEGLGAFGLSRKDDEETMMYTLQKFSDDEFMKTILPRLSDDDMERMYLFFLEMVKKYISEDEYHNVYLKDDHHH